MVELQRWGVCYQRGLPRPFVNIPSAVLFHCSNTLPFDDVRPVPVLTEAFVPERFELHLQSGSAKGPSGRVAALGWGLDTLDVDEDGLKRRIWVKEVRKEGIQGEKQEKGEGQIA